MAATISMRVMKGPSHGQTQLGRAVSGFLTYGAGMGILESLKRALRLETDQSGAADTQAPRRTKSAPAAEPTTVRTTVSRPETSERADYVSQWLSPEEAAGLIVPDEQTGALPITVRGGNFVHPSTGKKLPPASRVMAAHGVVSFFVRGTAHYPGHRTANTSPGQPADLRREPKNEYDANAVAVYAKLPSGRASKVGYVNKGLARGLAKRMDGGENLQAAFMRGHPPGEEGFRPAVVILDDTFRRRIPGLALCREVPESMT
ncbi:HIRAN domain-containing protein [Tessaracoccus sp. Y36]